MAAALGTARRAEKRSREEELEEWVEDVMRQLQHGQAATIFRRALSAGDSQAVFDAIEATISILDHTLSQGLKDQVRNRVILQTAKLMMALTDTASLVRNVSDGTEASPAAVAAVLTSTSHTPPTGIAVLQPGDDAPSFPAFARSAQDKFGKAFLDVSVIQASLQLSWITTIKALGEASWVASSQTARSDTADHVSSSSSSSSNMAGPSGAQSSTQVVRGRRQELTLG